MTFMNPGPGDADLTCPKCGGAMRAYERNGITVDQCSGCRGVFLDRGELEHLIDAEAAYLKVSPADSYRQPRPGEYRGGHGDGHGGGHDSRRGRRGGFLGGLFD